MRCDAPQKVISVDINQYYSSDIQLCENVPKMIEWLMKLVIGSQWSGRRYATGSPHVDGVGWPFVTS